MTVKTLTLIGLTVFATASLISSARGDIITGLQADWAFDDGPGSSTAVDSSGNGNTGTLTSFADATFMSMWVNGRFGDALLFNANGETTNDVSIPDAGGVDFASSKAFTLAAWVYCSVPGSAQSNGAPILSKGAIGLQSYSLDVSGGVFRCTTRNSNGKSQQAAISTVSPLSNTWYHVVGVWSASPQQHLIYINGSFNNTESGSGFLTSQFNTNAPLTIGSAVSTNAGNPVVPFQGIVDDVHLYNRVLTPSDIYELYTNGATAANAPAITTQPRNVSAYLGDSAVFGVGFNVSTTLLPVTYQWQLNGSNISGATSSTLAVTNAQATNAGAYSVLVGNFEGTNNSSNAVLTLSSLPAANTTNGLVGYWKFDDGSGSSTAADSSGNGNTGQLSGFADATHTSMWTNGVFNGALAFNGDGTGSNLVAVPGVGANAPAILDFSANPVLSLSAWVNGTTNTGGIIAKGTGGGGEQYVLDVNGGHYRFFVRDTNGTGFTAQTAVAPNTNWQQVVGVLNASNGIMNCYVNGQLAASALAPSSLQTNSHELSIGNRQAGAGAYGLSFNGILDDVRIYNRALTSADAGALYAAKAAPLLITWQASSYDVVAGVNAQLSPALQGGILPYTYQWQLNGSNIPGATQFPLTLTNAGTANAGSYDLILSDSNIVPAVTSSVVTLAIEPYLTFNATGQTWAAQGTLSPTNIWQGSNVAELTGFSNTQSNSVFYSFPLNVAAFQASFTYQVTMTTNSPGPGDGLVFCIQNDPRGPAALGANAIALGVSGIGGNPGGVAITPSVEFELDINSGSSPIGVSWNTNGTLGPETITSPLVLDNGFAGSPRDPVNVTINYEAGVATVTLIDMNAGTEFSITNDLDIPGAVGGNLAYVGFTASTGAAYCIQQVSDFTYQSLVNLSITNGGSSVMLAWPTGVGGYVLQQNTDLTTTNWVNVTNVVSLVGGQNQVTVPTTGSAQYFQLVLPP